MAICFYPDIEQEEELKNFFQSFLCIRTLLITLYNPMSRIYSRMLNVFRNGIDHLSLANIHPQISTLIA